MFYYFLSLVKEFLECDRYKKLYSEEVRKYEDLKLWTEKVLSSNKELMEQLQNEIQ